MVAENPKTFLVHNDLTIDCVEYVAQITRGEAFDFGDYELQSPQHLADRAEEIQPIMWELERQYDEYRSKTIDALSDNDVEKVMYEKVWPERKDGEVINNWLLKLSYSAFSDLCVEMKKWAVSEPDWSNEEANYFSIPASGQDYAFMYFRDLFDIEANEKLGVQIIEGEHPASTYYAATLTKPIDEANLIAVSEDIPVRFITEYR